MSQVLPNHGDPEEQVFGFVGQFLGSDQGLAYKKISDNLLKAGWQELGATPTPTITSTSGLTPTPTRTVTPTPTMTKTLTCTPTLTLTRTVTPTLTVTATSGSVMTPTPTPTITRAPPTPGLPTQTPTLTLTQTLTPTPGSSPQPTPTVPIYSLTTNRLIVSNGPEGQSPGGAGPDGSGSYLSGTFVNSIIYPDVNTAGTLRLDGVDQVTSDGTATCSVSIEMTGNRTATAVWAWKNVTWAVSTRGGGSGSVAGPGGFTSGTAKKLATINVEATITDPSSSFVRWDGNYVLFGSQGHVTSSAQLIGDGNHAIVATIVKKAYNVEGTRDTYGRLAVDYIDSTGNSGSYSTVGTPGSYVYPAFCASQITSVIYGTGVALTSARC
jgi:hypothetical protein